MLTSRLVESVKWNATVRLFEIGLRLVSSLVIVRGLGVKLYGLNASINSLLTFLPIVLSLGFDPVIQVLVPRWLATEEERGRVRALVGRLVRWRLAIFGAAGVVLYLAAEGLAAWVREPEVELYLQLAVPALVINGVASLYANVIQARLQIRWATLFSIGLQVIGLLAAFFLLRAGWGIVGLLVWGNVAAAASLAFYAANASRLLPGGHDGVEMTPVLRFAGAAWLTAICGQLLQKEIDIVVLNLFRTPWEAIAAYNLGVSLGLTLGALTNGTGPLFQGAFAEAAQRFERRRLGSLWQVAIKTSAVLWVPPLIFVLAFAPEIVARFYGEAFRRAALVFQVMALPQLSYGLLGGSFSSPLFFAVGRVRLALGFRIAAGSANLVLDLALVPYLGIAGAMIATSVAMVGGAAAEMVMVYRLTGVTPPGRFLAKWMGAFALAGGSALLVPDAGWLGWPVRLVVYLVVAFTFLRVFRPLEAEDRAALIRHMPMGRLVFSNL